MFHADGECSSRIVAFALGFLGEFGLETARGFQELLCDRNTERLFSGSTENKEY